MSIVSFRFVSYRTGRKPPPTISCLVFLPFRSVPFLSVPSRSVPFRFVPFRSFACLVHARTPSFASLRIRTRVSNADLVSWINVSTHEFQPVSSFVRSFVRIYIGRSTVISYERLAKIGSIRTERMIFQIFAFDSTTREDISFHSLIDYDYIYYYFESKSLGRFLATSKIRKG